MRILLVDDDPIFRKELADLLDGEGHASTPVGSTDEAMAALESERFDALLTDLRMPRRSGTVLLDEVRRRWPGLRSIILTGQPSDEAIATSLAHGAFNFIGKPCQVEEVLWVLDLVRQDAEFEAALAPPWSPSAVPGPLRAADPRSTLLWGPPVEGLPAGTELPSGLAEETGAASAPTLTPRPQLLVLNFGTPSPRDLPADRCLRLTRLALGLGGPELGVVALADDRRFAPADLLSFWALLRGTPVPEVRATLGPQRREILRLLEGREVDLPKLAREMTSDYGQRRARLYLEHLVRHGLVEVLRERYRLTPAGQAVRALLGRLDADGPALPPGRHLFRTSRPPKESGAAA